MGHHRQPHGLFIPTGWSWHHLCVSTFAAFNLAPSVCVFIVNTHRNW